MNLHPILRLFSFYLFLSTLFISSQAWATSFFIRPFSEFTKNTPNVVRGVISNVHAEKVLMPSGESIHTYANLAVKEIFKGSIRAENILIRKTGGTADGVTLEIPSSVELEENEDAVLFLSDEREDHAYEVTGMELGKFGLKQENGQEILTGGIFNYSHAPDDEANEGHQENVQAADIRENLRPWSLVQLRELIRSQGATPESTQPTIKNPAPTTLTQRSEKSALAPNTLAGAADDLNQVKNEFNSNSLSSSIPWFPLSIVGLICCGIILYAKRRK